MPVYPVTSVPKFITGTNIQPYIVKNSGSNTVYVGQDSSLTIESRSFSITPGGVMQWPGQSSEIWARTLDGEESEIEILFESQAQYTPGPDRVTAFNKWAELSVDDGTHVLPPLQSEFFPSLTDTYDVSNYTTVAISIFRETPLVSITPVYVTLYWPGSGVRDTYRMSVNGRIRIRTSVKSARLQIGIKNGTSNPPTVDDFVYSAPTVWASATPADDYYRHGYFFSFANIAERAVQLTAASSNIENWESGFSQFNIEPLASTNGFYYYDSIAGETELAVLQDSLRQLRVQSLPTASNSMITTTANPANTLITVDAPVAAVQVVRFVTPPTPMRFFVRNVEATTPAMQLVLSTL